MIKSSIKEAFTSNDPKMVAMRSEMFRQAGLPCLKCNISRRCR
jgi:hypothetical protein